MNRKDKQIVFDQVLKHFDGVRSEMIHAINEQLKRRGMEMVSRQAIMAWRENGVPPGSVIAVELATDGNISRERIRPELYA